jgi:hypothetical protein
MKGNKLVMSADEKKWQAEDDLRALCRAEEIKLDPKRLAAAKAMATERKAELAGITGITCAKE